MELCSWTGCSRVIPIEGTKLMMLRSSTEMFFLNGVVVSWSWSCSELSYEKKENGHRCGAYHKVSDAKVRMTKATEYLMYNVFSACVPFFWILWVGIYTSVFLFLLAVGIALMVILFSNQQRLHRTLMVGYFPNGIEIHHCFVTPH